MGLLERVEALEQEVRENKNGVRHINLQLLGTKDAYVRSDFICTILGMSRGNFKHAYTREPLKFPKPDRKNGNYNEWETGNVIKGIAEYFKNVK